MDEPWIECAKTLMYSFYLCKKPHSEFTHIYVSRAETPTIETIGKWDGGDFISR